MVHSKPARTPLDAAIQQTGDTLREQAYEILTRSYQRAERVGKGSGLVVYRSSAQLIHDLCGERWVRATVFPRETRLVKRFLKATGLGPADPVPVVQRSLMGNVWARIWTEILLELERDAFARVCSVGGREHLITAMSAGRGAILAHSHTLFAQLFWRWLEHQELDSGLTLWQWTWSKSESEYRDPKNKALEGARELHVAVSTLRREGLVHVLADGHHGGNRYIEVPFFNRRRQFRLTFAELAVHTGAPVLTVDVALQRDGQIAMEISPQLKADSDATERQKRVDSLVLQYVHHLHRRWDRYPAAIPWLQMGLHLEWPRL